MKQQGLRQFNRKKQVGQPIREAVSGKFSVETAGIATIQQKKQVRQPIREAVSGKYSVETAGIATIQQKKASRTADPRGGVGQVFC